MQSAAAEYAGIEPLRPITPSATDQDWAAIINSVTIAFANRHPQVRQHVDMGIRTLESEIAAQIWRRGIVEASIEPGFALRPAVMQVIQARIHRLSQRLAELHAFTPKFRGRIECPATAKHPYEDHIRTVLQNAVWVIRHSRIPRNSIPPGYQCSMPDPLVSFWDAFGREKAEVTKQLPSAREISDCDAVLPWFYLVDPKARAVLFLRLTPLSWRKVGNILGISHTKAMLMERDAVRDIARAIFPKANA